MSGEPRDPQTADEDVPQDPGVPGKDVISDASATPLPDEKDPTAESRERPDDLDDEGHMGEPAAPSR
jgi:hypothetical protein